MENYDYLFSFAEMLLIENKFPEGRGYSSWIFIPPLVRVPVLSRHWNEYFRNNNSFTVSQKVIHRITMRSSNFTARFIAQGIENRYSNTHGCSWQHYSG